LAVNKIQEKINLDSVPGNQIAFTTFMTSLEESFNYINKTDHKFKHIYQYHPKVTSQNLEAQNIIHHEAHLFATLVGLNASEDHLILIADGCGSNIAEYNQFKTFGMQSHISENFFESISIYRFYQGKIEIINKIFAPLFMVKKYQGLYSPASYFTACSQLVFGDWEYAGKVMGLAAYNKSERLSHDELFHALSTYQHNEKVDKITFDNYPKEKFDRFALFCDSTQVYFEDYFQNLLEDLKRQFPSTNNLVLTGGCALNCIYNEKLRRQNLFENISVPAWPNDEGVALGAAVGAYFNIHHKLPLINNPQNPFAGEKVDNREATIRKEFVDFKIEPLDLNQIVKLIEEQEVIAWFQGASECGPRALGHRSILCSPYISNIKKYLNDNIKFREAFRPYGCSCLEEQQAEYFEMAHGLFSPYMSFAPIVKLEYREKLKEVLHPDNSIRIQTVTRDFGDFYDLLKLLQIKTGHSIVIHTSLNINKQPILETIKDAYQFFQNNKIQYMVVDQFLISKSN
jgi:carbamoyltransferase